jgi:hypothetical protein
MSRSGLYFETEVDTTVTRRAFTMANGRKFRRTEKESSEIQSLLHKAPGFKLAEKVGRIGRITGDVETGEVIIWTYRKVDGIPHEFQYEILDLDLNVREISREADPDYDPEVDEDFVF